MRLSSFILIVLIACALTSNAQYSIFKQLDIAYTTPADYDLYPKNGKIIDKIIVADYDSVGTKFRLKHIEVIQFDGDNIISRTTNFDEPDPEYNFGVYNSILKYENNRLTEIRSFNAKNGEKVLEEFILYDAKNLPKALTSLNTSGIVRTARFSFDNGQISFTEYDEKAQLDGKTLLKLNNSNQLIRKTYKSKDYSTVTDYTYTTLNIAGRNIAKVKTEKDVEYKKGNTYTYNTAGDIISNKFSQRVGLGTFVHTNIYDYKYRNNGLWLERFQVKKGSGAFSNTKLKYTKRMIFYTDGTSEGNFNYYFSGYLNTKWGGKVKVQLPLDIYKFKTTLAKTSAPVKARPITTSSSQQNSIDTLVRYFRKILLEKDSKANVSILYLTESAYNKIKKDNTIKDKSAYIAAFMEKLHKQEPAKKLLFSFMMGAVPIDGWMEGFEKTSAQTKAEVKNSAQGAADGYKKHMQKVNDKYRR